MSSAIYQIINTITKQIYIGQSINPVQRLRQHARDLRRSGHCNQVLQRAWLKYGESAFEMGILEYVEKEFLTEREQFWIEVFRASHRPWGYNLCPAAKSCKGYKHTKETIDKRRGRIPWNKGMQGKYKLPPASMERKRKIGSAQRGKLNHNYGKAIPNEVKERIRASLSGSKCHLAKLSENMVSEIKAELLKGTRPSVLARRYSVGKTQISCIKNGKTWRHVK